jgi:hypothetical protein
MNAVYRHDLVDIAIKPMFRIEDMERPIPHGGPIEPVWKRAKETVSEYGGAGWYEMIRNNVRQGKERFLQRGRMKVPIMLGSLLVVYSDVMKTGTTFLMPFEKLHLFLQLQGVGPIIVALKQRDVLSSCVKDVIGKILLTV